MTSAATIQHSQPHLTDGENQSACRRHGIHAPANASESLPTGSVLFADNLPPIVNLDTPPETRTGHWRELPTSQ